ncbi:hypothetical protein MRB53_016659 [Persea americana]|uniref:Uncharacterized protein n=1 Tax=Persea americana TaxID=3435 RepID=A0ACC2M2V6_PERAE|nr:hypothetical protein MRB53_016659 [Persea americana]
MKQTSDLLFIPCMETQAISGATNEKLFIISFSNFSFCHPLFPLPRHSPFRSLYLNPSLREEEEEEEEGPTPSEL